MSALDTGTDHLLGEISDHILTLTLNRPERRNALGTELSPALRQALLDADTNPDVRCIILTGAGGAFCAGGDVTAMGEGSERESRSAEDNIRILQDQQRTLSQRIFELSKPVIAAIPGAAAGAGMSIALACDMRIAAERAFFAPAFGNIGLSGDYGGSWYMTQLIGPARTREIYYTGRRVMANEAHALGLVNNVVADEELMDRTREMASAIASAAPLAVRYMKGNISRAMQAGLPECLDWEADRMIRCMATEDHKDAVKAFHEKRKPVFRGR